MFALCVALVLPGRVLHLRSLFKLERCFPCTASPRDPFLSLSYSCISIVGRRSTGSFEMHSLLHRSLPDSVKSLPCLGFQNCVRLDSFSDFCLFQESKSDSLSIATRKVLDYLEAYQKIENLFWQHQSLWCLNL